MLNPGFFSQMPSNFDLRPERSQSSSHESTYTSPLTINSTSPQNIPPSTSSRTNQTPQPDFQEEPTVQSCADLSLSRSADPLYSNTNFSLSSPVFIRQINSTISSAPRILPYDLWECDSDTASCHSCHKNFSLFIRRHHCRRCGLIYCDQCSSSRAEMYDFSFRLDGPGFAVPEETAPTPQRVCEPCHNIIRSGPRIPHIEVPVSMRRTDSQSSILTECPVCTTRLINISKEKKEQESHINSCLETNSFDGTRNSSRYLVFSLKNDSPLIQQECTICMEEYSEGDRIARLNCLCCFHRNCIQEWFLRNNNCPVHFQ
ncbi:hypothetical protein DSO57_1021483 [Entomophthora muscae]|uniref:Uncharacterized protein n=1 Tax=Entomophthora muscae TaxID=34485 RepID=A0ACC2UP89_9FUNG|nr:hypothetical protein DSO57_1021483 [Entomophthora muscae]